jgi:hypothetical protein
MVRRLIFTNLRDVRSHFYLLEQMLRLKYGHYPTVSPASKR